MLFNVAALLLFAGTAIAAQLSQGTYRITNVASGTTARVYTPGGDIFVSSTRENPGPFELWEIKSAQDGYTINNVGLKAGPSPDSFAAVSAPEEGASVLTDRQATVFAIGPAGDGTVVIKLPFDDLLWNVEPPVNPTGKVQLRPADGDDTEKWYISPA